MTCVAQNYNHQLETEREISNELDNRFLATRNWQTSCRRLELDVLPTEDECAPDYYQPHATRNVTVPETESKSTTFQSQGKAWWESEFAPPVYKALKEREECLAKIEYRSPQLMSR